MRRKEGSVMRIDVNWACCGGIVWILNGFEAYAPCSPLSMGTATTMRNGNPEAELDGLGDLEGRVEYRGIGG